MPNYNTGPAHNRWKGGRSIASNGYVLVRVGKRHHLADVRGYAYEHRLVAEEKLGRRLTPGEIPHHINGIKQAEKLRELADDIGILFAAIVHQIHFIDGDHEVSDAEKVRDE